MKFAGDVVSSFQQGILDCTGQHPGEPARPAGLPAYLKKLHSPVLGQHLCRFPNPLSLKNSPTLKHCPLASFFQSQHTTVLMQVNVRSVLFQRFQALMAKLIPDRYWEITGEDDNTRIARF